MQKPILISTVTHAIFAITSCISRKKINLSDEVFCKTPIVRAELIKISNIYN